MNTAGSIVARKTPRRTLKEAIEAMAKVFHPGKPESQARLIEMHMRLSAEHAVPWLER